MSDKGLAVTFTILVIRGASNSALSHIRRFPNGAMRQLDQFENHTK
jgi:hypothetical protein